jgi:hypothetical protein
MPPTRRTIRSVAAVIAAGMAFIYFGIGLGLLDIGGSAADRTFLFAFGALAGGAFLLGAILLFWSDRRWVWILGVAFQVFVYWAYVDVSKQRTPPFEVWGITLRIIQFPLLGALVYLAARAPQGTPARRAPGERRQPT